ncbi:MAG: hypothetical protein KI791_16475, partial [Cyclobacteriaceae bacterium]|nr:hypothetical protein [Cyclobacteriaceae bacterium SS2]
MGSYKLQFILCLSALLFTCCDHSLKWETVIKASGTYSSPRAIDLNGDGIKDIVLGAGGRREWESSENGVLAFNGRDGSILWKKDCRNQLVGSPIFHDITGDDIPDVFIGGRSAQFMALNGATGQLIWEYLPTVEGFDFSKDTTILNFFSPQFVSDQDQDETPDLIVSYGGYVEAKPSDYDRPTGYLMIFSTRTGEVLTRVSMPDTKETYISPVVWMRDNQEHVLFGTGGETIAGNLYVTAIEDLMDGNIDQYEILVRGEYKGFIAPPVLVDINKDQNADIIVNAYEGMVYALDGQSLKPVWAVNLGLEYESHSQPAIGDFTGDPTPDLFVNYGMGAWPNITGAVQVIIDGHSGVSSVIDSVGYLQYASPIAVEKNDKVPGKILMPINDLTPTNYSIESGKPPYAYQNILYLFDPRTKMKEVVYSNPGTNTGSTLLIDDLNNDGSTELIYVYNLNPFDAFEHNGFVISCETMDYNTRGWNQYM